MFDVVSWNKPVLGEESRQILIDHFLLKVRLRKHYLMKKPKIFWSNFDWSFLSIYIQLVIF